MDDRRIAVLGFSDGASFALSLAVNLAPLQAALLWAPGYFHRDPHYASGDALLPLAAARRKKPRVYHGHGAKDELFAFKKVAKPIRKHLKDLGFNVTAADDKKAGHGVPGRFVETAVQWWLNLKKR